MNHEPDDLLTIRQIMSTVARDYSDTTENTDLIREEVVERVASALSEGLLDDDVPSETDLFRQWVRGEFKRTADNNGKALKNRLRRGFGAQGALDLGDDLDMVLTVCSRLSLGDGATCGRTTTLGLATADDLLLIGSESRLNARDVMNADRELQEQLGVAVPELRQWDNYAAYMRALKSARGESAA